jgi:hypothetical protein
VTSQEKEEIIFDENTDRKLSLAYKGNPTIDNYLKLRRENPSIEIEIAITNGLEWLFANEGLLRENGIEPQWFASSLDANAEAISKLSLHLLGKLNDRSLLEKDGETQIISRGKGISDSLVNYLAAVMLDALSWNDDLEIPRDLIVLLRHQLFGSGEPAQLKQLQSKQLEDNIGMIGAQLLEYGKEPSTREIAKLLGINASTVSRIFPGNSLLEESQKRLDMFKGFHKSETPFADMKAKRRG